MHRLTAILYADTAIHFIAMAAAVMLWTRYVVSYLKGSGRYGRFLTFAGLLFLAFEAAAVVLNFFFPILFTFGATAPMPPSAPAMSPLSSRSCCSC